MITNDFNEVQNNQKDKSKGEEIAKCTRCSYTKTREVDKIAQETGCDVISLQVENNSWMKDWYLRKGFIPVADGYDSNNVIMSKFIDSTKGE